uniref:type II secretion system F family protein n=1 Tax=Candidatus Electronema sp. TaxID=2698783 RepID=UPI0040568B85
MSSRLSIEELCSGWCQLAVMLRAGVSLPGAVTALSAEKDLPVISKAAAGMRKEMDQGVPFAECLNRRTPRLFNAALQRIMLLDIPAAQKADALRQAAVAEESFAKAGSTGKPLLRFVTMVFSAVMLLAFFMLIFVLPVFDEMYASMGGHLPVPTQLFLNIGSLFIDNVLVQIVFALLFIFAFVYVRKFPYHAARHVPGIGPLLKKVAVAQFAQYFSLLTAAGLPFKESLQGAADSVSNSHLAARFKRFADGTADMPSLQAQMRQSGLFPEMLLQAAGAAATQEAAGSAMGEAAAFYGNDIGNAAAKKIAMLEVLALVVLGVLVGAIVISMYLPIFMMADAI